MHLELQRADAVRYAFDVIAQAMGEVVHRVEAPLVTGMMMRRVANAIKDGVAQPDVRRGHVDLRTKRTLAVGKLAGLHAREEGEVLVHRTVAVRRVLAGAVGRAAIGVRFGGGKIADIGLALSDQGE